MLNNFKWYRKLKGGSWYKIYYQLPEGDIKWSRSGTKRGFGAFKILKQEHYE